MPRKLDATETEKAQRRHRGGEQEKSTGSDKDYHLLLLLLAGASDCDWEDEQASGGTRVILMEIGAYGRSPEQGTATALAQPPLALLGMT